jgi:hypothetical protein
MLRTFGSNQKSNGPPTSAVMAPVGLHDALAEPQEEPTGERRKGDDHCGPARAAGAHEGGRRQPDEADETHTGRDETGKRSGKRGNRETEAAEAHAQAARAGVAEPENQKRADHQGGENGGNHEFDCERIEHRPVLLAERTAVPGDERHQIFALGERHRGGKGGSGYSDEQPGHDHGHRLEGLAPAERKDDCRREACAAERDRRAVTVHDLGRVQRGGHDRKLRAGRDAQCGRVGNRIAQQLLKERAGKPECRARNHSHGRPWE